MTAQSTRNTFEAKSSRTRRRLLLSCAMGAAVAGMMSGRASAQSVSGGAFQGTPTIAGGQATIARTPTVDTITVSSPSAIINWTTNDTATGGGAINFLPQGNTGIFQNDGAATANFSVLNRIIPTDPNRPVAFNGAVISRLRDSAGNVTGPGGTVAFYSPGGILIGSTATFDVGSLLLTALDPVNFATAGAGGTFQLRGAAGSQAAVVIQQGAQLNALAQNSYIAVAAPRIQQDGQVRVNGSAAYVAAESVDLTINNGLFDINVLTGTGDANGIVHNGSTGGPASTGGTDNHRIYMVAVPKNQVLTALLGGSAGFDAASNVSVENGAIILSAGYGIDETATGPVFTSPQQNASFNINPGTYSSDIQGFATADFFAAPTNGSMSFAGDISLVGGNRAHIAGRNGNT
ncbi:MAG: hypothetical protein AVDCRST_MAG91-326, partial [uncultured Sphingomonadaceae bacterium]